MTEQVAERIPGYTYGTSEVGASPLSLEELGRLKVSVGFADEDRRYLQMAGEVLGDQTRAVVLHWRRDYRHHPSPRQTFSVTLRYSSPGLSGTEQ